MIESPKKISDSQMLVSTFKQWPMWERGIMRIDENGIFYVPIVQSAIGGLLLGMFALYAIFILITSFSGIYIGLLTNLLIFSGLAIIGIIFGIKMQKTSNEQEKIALDQGLEVFQTIKDQWKVKWEDLDQIKLIKKKQPHLQITTKNENIYEYQIFVPKSAIENKTVEESYSGLKDFIEKNHQIVFKEE
jgi:hypothetical protein